MHVAQSMFMVIAELLKASNSQSGRRSRLNACPCTQFAHSGASTSPNESPSAAAAD